MQCPLVYPSIHFLKPETAINLRLCALLDMHFVPQLSSNTGAPRCGESERVVKVESKQPNSCL